MESLKMKINASKFASLWRRERRRGITMLSLSQVPVLSMLCTAFVASHLLQAGHFACWKSYLV